MPFLVFILLFVCYLVSGYGLLTIFGMRLKTAYMITLSLLLGIAVASFVPFLLQLFYIALTPITIFGSLLLAALALNIPTWRRIKKEGFPAVRRSFALKPFRILPYEIPWLLIFGFFVFVSIWRCYYLPPTSRDALSGPEAIADFAVREHTMINSFFNVDLWSTNNQFKSPYLISLQMICKMAGFPFGQVWLSVVFVSFTVFLYHALKEKVHPIIAGLLLLLFLMTPEMYAYTFMILYDYSNMIFFFLSLYFLFDYFKSGILSHFYFAGLLMGIATYIRSETLALAVLFLPVILLSQRRNKDSFTKMVRADVAFFLPSLLGYYLTAQLYIKYYLPVHYDIGSLVNDHLSDLNPLFQRYSDIVTRLMASVFGIQLWGYILYFTAFLFLAEGIFVRRYSREARNWLYSILVLYLGVGALGFLLPMMNLNETTKRALFKLLPLAVLYLANNELLIRLSQWISRWEGNPIHLFAAEGRPAPALQADAVLTKKDSVKTGKWAPAPARGKTAPAPAARSSSKKKKR
jgi:Dolichyl-phosphate-mannose-protein mannosyltransferase